MNLARLCLNLLEAAATRSLEVARRLAEDVPVAVDFSQANRRMRRAWTRERHARGAYLTLTHQRRRLRRRREIRALVEGPSRERY
ncbi:MAG: hypothetical protein KF688_11470 [Pirellulales bacterium]|nr:hypothetical protein [Pirellulales bacterium]